MLVGNPGRSLSSHRLYESAVVKVGTDRSDPAVCLSRSAPIGQTGCMFFTCYNFLTLFALNRKVLNFTRCLTLRYRQLAAYVPWSRSAPIGQTGCMFFTCYNFLTLFALNRKVLNFTRCLTLRYRQLMWASICEIGFYEFVFKKKLLFAGRQHRLEGIPPGPLKGEKSKSEIIWD